MKLIAHRGWSQGEGENTLAAFARAAADPRVSGIEFDIRRGTAGELLVTHDPPRGDTPVLTLEAALAFLAGTNLELFVEIKDNGIVGAAIERLVAAGVAERSVVFGFVQVARSFPWSRAPPVRLGAILVYPWTMRRFTASYDPDVILLGWDERRWTRVAFRAWWAAFSLERLARRTRKPIVAGIVRRPSDLRWLAAQQVYAAVADMDFIASN
jgi:glycerophosphoryl diester phosphodiesterase